MTTCNPSYPGLRDQEDHGSKPAQANICETLAQKSPTQKRTGRAAQTVGTLPSSNLRRESLVGIGEVPGLENRLGAPLREPGEGLFSWHFVLMTC
jgi:hypothetical protein